MTVRDLCLVEPRLRGDEATHELVDRYVEFVAARCRPNTVAATRSDLGVFFSVVDKPPVEVLLRRGEFTPLAPPADASADPRATSLGGMNDRGQIVGGTYAPGATPDANGFFPIDAHDAVVRDRRGRYTRIDIPGVVITLAYDINDRSAVVGQYIDAGAVEDAEGRLPFGTVHGFRRRGGEVTTIDVPGAALTQPLGINDRGDVVGAYLEAVPSTDPYAYYETGRLRGFVMRRGTFTPIDFPGGLGTKVSGINDRGEMVGYYDTNDARRASRCAKAASP